MCFFSPKFLRQSLHSFEVVFLNSKGVSVTFPPRSPALCFSGYSVRYLGLTLPHSLRRPSWQVLLPGHKHMTNKCVLSEQTTLLCPGTYCEDLCLLQGPAVHQNTWSSHHVLALCQVLQLGHWDEQLGVCPLGTHILVTKTDVKQVR